MSRMPDTFPKTEKRIPTGIISFYFTKTSKLQIYNYNGLSLKYGEINNKIKLYLAFLTKYF